MRRGYICHENKLLNAKINFKVKMKKHVLKSIQKYGLPLSIKWNRIKFTKSKNNYIYKLVLQLYDDNMQNQFVFIESDQEEMKA